MTGDTPPPRLQREGTAAVTVADLLELATWMRGLVSDAKDDLRRDLSSGHDILAAKIDVIATDAREIAAAQRDFEVVHAQQHIRDDNDWKVWKDKLSTFVQAAELAKARRDGLLGGVRFAFNLIGSNWRGIVALAGLLGVLLGNIHVSLGAVQ